MTVVAETLRVATLYELGAPVPESSRHDAARRVGCARGPVLH